MIVVGIFLLIVPEEEVSMSYESVSQASYSSKLLSSFFFLLCFCSSYFIFTTLLWISCGLLYHSYSFHRKPYHGQLGHEIIE